MEFVQKFSVQILAQPLLDVCHMASAFLAPRFSFVSYPEETIAFIHPLNEISEMKYVTIVCKQWSTKQKLVTTMR